MKIERFSHLEVNSDGTVIGGGAVETKPFIRMSVGNGCGLAGCHCSEGYWISIGEGLKNKTVEGIKVTFKNKKEFREFMSQHRIVGGD